MEQQPKSPKPIREIWLLVAVCFLFIVPLWWSASREIARARQAAAALRTPPPVLDHVLLQLGLTPDLTTFPKDSLKATVALWETDAFHDEFEVTTATLLTTATLTALAPTSITLNTSKSVIATILDGNVRYLALASSEVLPDLAPGWYVRRHPLIRQATPQVLRVSPAATITGRLLDQDARPIADMSVKARDVPPSHYKGHSDFRVRTDPDGQFRVRSPLRIWDGHTNPLFEANLQLETADDAQRNQASAILTVRFNTDDFPNGTRLGDIVVPLGQGFQSLYETVLTPRSQLSARVTDEAGNPANLVSVQQLDSTRLDGGPRARISKSPDRSKFQFDGLTTGNMALRVFPDPPFVPFIHQATIAEPGTSITLPDIVAPRGRTLRVRVVDMDTSQSVAGTTVSISTNMDPPFTNEKLDRSAVSDADGIAILSGLPRTAPWPWVTIGKNSIHATAYGPPTNELTVEFPVGTATVRIHCDGTRGGLGELALDGNGHFYPLPILGVHSTNPPIVHEFAGLPAGQYRVRSKVWEDYCVFADGQPQATVKPGQAADIYIRGPMSVIPVALPPADLNQDVSRPQMAKQYRGTFHFWLAPENSASDPKQTHYELSYAIGQNIVVAVPPGQRITRMQFREDKGRTATLNGDQLDRLAPADRAKMTWDTEGEKP
jgi:hypothetical protein